MHAAASAAEIAEAVAAGKVSAVRVVEATLRRIGERDKTLNAFTAVTGERAMARARAVDAERAAGRRLGVLAGVPFAAKNLFDVAGLTTLAGSEINPGRPPPPARAPPGGGPGGGGGGAGRGRHTGGGARRFTRPD